jgi:hypothetical protein
MFMQRFIKFWFSIIIDVPYFRCISLVRHQSFTCDCGPTTNSYPFTHFDANATQDMLLTFTTETVRLHTLH